MDPFHVRNLHTTEGPVEAPYVPFYPQSQNANEVTASVRNIILRSPQDHSFLSLFKMPLM